MPAIVRAHDPQQINERPFLPFNSLLYRPKNHEQFLSLTYGEMNQAELQQTVAINKNDYKNLKTAIFHTCK